MKKWIIQVESNKFMAGKHTFRTKGQAKCFAEKWLKANIPVGGNIASLKLFHMVKGPWGGLIEKQKPLVF